MSDEKDQIVAYLRRSAQRYREALDAANERDSIDAALTSFFTLINCATAIERGDHRKENDA